MKPLKVGKSSQKTPLRIEIETRTDINTYNEFFTYK